MTIAKNLYDAIAGLISGILLIITEKDIEITDTTKGIILKAPDGGRWRITISNDGLLTTTQL